MTSHTIKPHKVNSIRLIRSCEHRRTLAGNFVELWTLSGGFSGLLAAGPLARGGVQGDRVHGRLGHPGAYPYQKPQVNNRRKHHPLRRELLDVMQQGFPYAMVT